MKKVISKKKSRIQTFTSNMSKTLSSIKKSTFENLFGTRSRAVIIFIGIMVD